MHLMTQVVVMQKLTPSKSSFLVGSEAKNPLPARSNLSWEDLAGLSWLILENHNKYGLD